MPRPLNIHRWDRLFRSTNAFRFTFVVLSTVLATSLLFISQSAFGADEDTSPKNRSDKVWLLVGIAEFDSAVQQYIQQKAGTSDLEKACGKDCAKVDKGKIEPTSSGIDSGIQTEKQYKGFDEKLFKSLKSSAQGIRARQEQIKNLAPRLADLQTLVTDLEKRDKDLLFDKNELKHKLSRYPVEKEPAELKDLFRKVEANLKENRNRLTEAKTELDKIQAILSEAEPENKTETENFTAQLRNLMDDILTDGNDEQIAWLLQWESEILGTSMTQLLLSAIESRDVVFAKKLISMGVNINASSGEYSPLAMATILGDDNLVALLTKYGAVTSTPWNHGEAVPLPSAILALEHQLSRLENFARTVNLKSSGLLNRSRCKLDCLKRLEASTPASRP